MRRSWKRSEGEKRGLKRNTHRERATTVEQRSTEKTERYEVVHTHCPRRAWPASIVYVEMVVGSRIDSTFASLPPMVRSSETYGNESNKTKISSGMLSFVCHQAFQRFRLEDPKLGLAKTKKGK